MAGSLTGMTGSGLSAGGAASFQPEVFPINLKLGLLER